MGIYIYIYIYIYIVVPFGPGHVSPTPFNNVGLHMLVVEA